MKVEPCCSTCCRAQGSRISSANPLAGARALFGRLAGCRWGMVDCFGRGSILGWLVGRLVVGNAVLEALNPLGDVAHQFGNLAAPEQQYEQQDDNQDLPNTWIHGNSPFAAQGTLRFSQNADGLEPFALDQGFQGKPLTLSHTWSMGLLIAKNVAFQAPAIYPAVRSEVSQKVQQAASERTVGRKP